MYGVYPDSLTYTTGISSGGGGGGWFGGGGGSIIWSSGYGAGAGGGGGSDYFSGATPGSPATVGTVSVSYPSFAAGPQAASNTRGLDGTVTISWS